MPFHGRGEMTRMSLFHLKRVASVFLEEGHTVHDFAIGEDEASGRFAEAIGIEWVRFPNDPLAAKMRHMYNYAASKDCDYICKADSNNLYTADFVLGCSRHMGGPWPKNLFGSNKFLVSSRKKDEDQTCIFTPRLKRHICGTMQFVKTSTLVNDVDLEEIYPDSVERKFDGKLNSAVYRAQGPHTVGHINEHDWNVLDIKSSENHLNTYNSYMKHLGSLYEEGPKKEELYDMFDELKMLDMGYFKEQ